MLVDYRTIRRRDQYLLLHVLVGPEVLRFDRGNTHSCLLTKSSGQAFGCEAIIIRTLADL